MTPWLHCVAEIDRTRLESALDEWGNGGWELVSLVLLPPPKGYSGSDLFLAAFKKPAIYQEDRTAISKSIQRSIAKQLKRK